MERHCPGGGDRAGERTLLFGNGDVHSYQDIIRRVRDTGVDGVLVGRAALGAPWFFRQKEEARLVLQQHRPAGGGEPWVPPLEVRFEVLLDHARRFESACGQDQFRRMRKHLGWYCKGFPHAASLRADMFRVSSVVELEQVLADFRMRSASFTEVSDQMLLEPQARIVHDGSSRNRQAPLRDRRAEPPEPEAYLDSTSRERTASPPAGGSS